MKANTRNNQENLVSNIKKLSSNSRNIIPYLNKNSYYNCWGFTSSMKGWTENLTWIDRDLMEYLLKEKTKHISKSKVKVGDIIVFRDEDYENELLHTAIITSPKRKEFIHKPGGCDLEMQNLEGTLGIHSYGNHIEIRRAL
jgi:signal peptidase I